MKMIANLGLIPRFDLDAYYKCKTYVEAKFAKKPFKSVQRTSKPIQLIQSDLCDLKFIENKGGKKYFITFMDDCTRFRYVYLLNSKDEAMSMFIKNKMTSRIKLINESKCLGLTEEENTILPI